MKLSTVFAKLTCMKSNGYGYGQTYGYDRLRHDDWRAREEWRRREEWRERQEWIRREEWRRAHRGPYPYAYGPGQYGPRGY